MATSKHDGKKPWLFLIFVLIFALMIFVLLQNLNFQNGENLEQLRKVEVKEYQGKNLDSIVDVRDVSIEGPQYINISQYHLELSGLVENPKNYTYDEVLSHKKYSKVVELHCTEGWSASVLWEGVLLKDLFNEAIIKNQTNTVIFYSSDGYTTSLPLDYIISRNIILAYKINNVTLVPERGFPFELVAEDKFGYKWIKWVTKIELSDNPNYLGYWETRGYSNSGDLN